jgi:hypothetical protein
VELVDQSILAKQQGDEAGSLELLRSPLAQAKLSAFEQERFSRGEASPTAANELRDLLLDAVYSQRQAI